MGFRFRRRIGPKGFKINVSKNGISSISLGGRGFSYNIPVNRKGGARTTVGIPGSGMSWSYEEKGNTNSGRAVSSTAATPALRPARKYPTRPRISPIDELTVDVASRGSALLTDLRATRKDVIAKVQVLGDYIKELTEKHGISDDDPRCKFFVSYWAWLNEEAEDIANPHWERMTVPANAQGIGSALMVLGALSFGVIFLAGVSGNLNPQVKQPTELYERSATTISAEENRRLMEEDAERQLQRRQAEAERQSRIQARRDGAARMNAAGYYQGSRGGCFRYTSGGNKDYVSRSICNGYLGN